MSSSIDNIFILNEIKKHYSIDSNANFARFLGIPYTTLTSWYARNAFDLALLYSKCVGIDANWLMTGRGEMFLSENAQVNVYPNVYPNVYLSEITEPKEPKSVHLNTQRLNETLIHIPVVNVEVAAGIGGAYNPDYINTDDTIVLPKSFVRNKPNLLCVKVKGQSMIPTLQDSSYLVVSQITDINDIREGHLYVITDHSGNAHIKRLKNRLESGFVVCMSDNIDKYSHPNFNLQTHEISTVWHAEWYISAKMPNINDNYYTRMTLLENEVADIKNLLLTKKK